MSMREQKDSPIGVLENPYELTPSKLEQLYDQVRKVYVSDNRPWVIGFSGGKDSTAVLQLIWLALSQLNKKELKKPLYVISSDTLVESPMISEYILEIHKKINAVAKQNNLPFHAEMVFPLLVDTFWVNMIGKGYPAPYQRFRWCTDRLKIRPANRFIYEKVESYGEVVLVLGVRHSESATRAHFMKLHRRVGDHLSRHSELKNAWVFTPIEFFSTDDVWSYLLSVPSPWGANNHELLSIYRNAQAGECPLVVDKTTPSCGNSRFGCWTCTVVERDKTMEAIIEKGEDWLEPLLELRNWLVETQDPETKAKYRMPRRRDGKVHFWGDNQDKLIWGPYKLKVRQEILRRLLQAQKKVRDTGPNRSITLISDEELHEIRRIWRIEEGDWEDTLPVIYQRIMGFNLDWPKDDLGQPNQLEGKLLEECGTEAGVSPALLKELIDIERHYQYMSRRAALYDRIDSILSKDWRSDQEIFSEQERRYQSSLEGKYEEN